MKKRAFLYIAALILFVFAVSVLIVHFSSLIERQRAISGDVRLPFIIGAGRTASVLPEGAALNSPTARNNTTT